MSGRERIPFLDIKAFQGLFTKASPESLAAEQLRICQNIDFFDEYGALAKIRGSSRVLATPYTEATVAKKISWLGFYKSADLDGTVLRHTLCAAGTIIGRMNGDIIDPLMTGRTADLYHSADRLDRLYFISNQNPDRVGEGDPMVKYDGAVMTNWGVLAPGMKQTVVEEFDDFTEWTRENCNASDQTNATVGDVTWDGEAMRINSRFYGFNTYHVTKAHAGDGFYVQGDSRDNSDAARNRVSTYAYIPRGALTASITHPTDTGLQTKGPAMSIYVSPDATPDVNNWQFDFPTGAVFEGWNKLNLDFASGAPGSGQLNSPAGIQTGSFYPEDQTVRSTRFEFYLATRNTVVSGIRLDRYNKTDEGTLVAVPSNDGDGEINGVYRYKVVYVSKYGQLSNAGPASVDEAADNATSIALTKIPVSSDPQVTARRIYRTVGNGSVYLFLTQILDNNSTTYTDLLADGSLGNETPPAAGDFSDDNSIPPQGGIVKTWKKTLFMAGDPQNPYTLYYSEDNEPESFPIINAFDMDGKITALYESYAGLVVETETGKWQVIGDNPDFSVDKIVDGMGCVGRRAAGTARLIGYAVDRDGMRLFDLSETKKISEPIRDKYDTDIDKVNIELIHCVHSKSKNLIMQFNPDSSGDYTSIFAYQYPMDAVETGYWTEIVTPSGANLNFLDAVEIEDANGDFQILASGDDGMIYRLFNNASKNWVDANGVEYAIDTKIQTPYFRPGVLGLEVEGATGRVNPRKMELRIATEDACTWECTVETADGFDQALARSSSTILMEAGANNSLIRQSVPSDETTPAEYVRLTLQNAEADVFSRFSALRIYYHVNPAVFDVTDVDNVVS
jgi:hypothetical protein